MDGSRWACHCGADCHLFVNAIHGEVDHARAFTEWGQFFEGSGQSDRTATRPTNARNRSQEVIDTPILMRES